MYEENIEDNNYNNSFEKLWGCVVNRNVACWTSYSGVPPVHVWEPAGNELFGLSGYIVKGKP